MFEETKKVMGNCLKGIRSAKLLCRGSDYCKYVCECDVEYVVSIRMSKGKEKPMQEDRN